MNILITGHKGYIGCLLTDLLNNYPNISLIGADLGLFEGCEIQPITKIKETETKDIRFLSSKELEGIDVVCHLAAISNDPMGDLDSNVTEEINLHGTIELARLSKKMGVKRFIFSGSCSIYGSSGDKEIDETGKMIPLSTYAKSKVLAEKELQLMSSDKFKVISLRNATAFGWSPSLRTDLVANNLSASAINLGKQVVFSDGEPWRPLVHCKDIANMFKEFCLINHIENNFLPINIGSSDMNVKVKDIVNIISEFMPEKSVEFKNIAPNDPRNYRVSFKKLERFLNKKNYLEYNLHYGIMDMINKMNYYHKKNKYDYLSSQFIRLETLKTRMDLIKL